MRVIQLISGIVSAGIGTVLCLPLAVLAWHAWPYSAAALTASPGTLPINTRNADFILSVGSLTLSGGAMWAFVAGLAFAGLALAGFGVYLVCSRDDNR